MKPDLFAQQRRDEKLAEHMRQLDELRDLVDFSAIADYIDETCPRPDRSRGGRPPYPTEWMVKILFLQVLYGNVSDESMECLLLDRRSFQRFLGAEDARDLPDARTIWHFKQRLAQSGEGAQAIFEAVQREIRKAGYTARGGQIVDATIVRAPKQQLSSEQKERARDGEMDPEWNESQRRQRDIEARWTKKHGHSFFGYKGHINVDRRYGFIRKLKTTPANADDGQQLQELIDRGNTADVLAADRGYDSAANRKLLRSQGLRDEIARRSAPNKPMSRRGEKRNKRINKVRAPVEHPFAWLEKMGAKTVRTIGLARAELGIAMQVSAYNLKRLVSLQRRGVVPV